MGRSRFNSATVVTPWKRELVPVARLDGHRLQFGHGCDAVETPGRSGAGIDSAGFNSATVVTPWKQRIQLHEGDVSHRFNSATVVTPWKPR